MNTVSRTLARGAASALLGVSLAATASAPVEVVALFKNRAMIRTADGQEMLKVGDTSAGGVTLLAADPRGAQVRLDGRIYDLELSTRVASRFAKAEARSIRIAQDQLGQYRVRGAINDQYVNFLVDTGASVVAISEREARALGIAYQRGERGTVQTAQGNAGAFFVKLDKVTVGGIDVHAVQATVIDGNFPTDVLLGMSFLKNVRMQDDAGVLTLTAKF